ncbi:hypothetical protein [Helicobacter apodemus]|uniref:HmcD domain-containing protein n=1 Tax=Helicobacter apodemus TaxID=135569 RepID=A0A2U8FE07_9HELI|nr:hypothetical protein [Helicobacter apodemus]AWI33635.1 hypothetical protein CDV25_01810 [Helicobacter apodemus]
MKKLLLTLLFLTSTLLASDELNIDNLFKKQIGLRSITSFSLLSTGNANTYSLYPNISIGGDTTLWDDTKQLSLNQAFIYTLMPKFDILVSGSGSYTRKEYTDTSSQNRIGFDNLWLGFIYTGKSIADFIPQITFQTAILQRESSATEDKSFYLKSQSLQATLRGYSDPVVYSIYSGLGYNAKRKFKIGKIDYGHSLYIGGDLSIILSPKITLDLGAEQRFQTKQKINGNQTSNIRSIPTFSVGSTYSLNQDTAISVNANFGGSSAAPDAIFGLTLWKKF